METKDYKFKLSKKALDLTGKKFGRLLVLEPIGRNKRLEVLWKCRCDCGNETIVKTAFLTHGHTRSCGCLQREKVSAIMTKHGMTGSPEHKAWSDMLQRCENPHHKAFDYYGGRNIKVCERWHDFRNFFADMGKRPEGMTLDRTENDGNYSPENCKWVSWKEQVMNRRPNSTGPNRQRCFFAVDWNTMNVFSADNQSQFARDHGLSREGIFLCLHHHQALHKGWTFSYCPEDQSC